MARKRTSEKELVVSSSMAAAPARRKTASVSRKKHAPTQLDAPSAPAVAEEGEPVACDGPTREAIAALAYSYWEARGYQGGDPEADWLRAEEELRTQSSVAVA